MYDTSNDEFFTNKGEINQDDPSFLFSLALNTEVAETFEKMQTLPYDDTYIAVVGSSALQIFDLSKGALPIINVKESPHSRSYSSAKDRDQVK